MRELDVAGYLFLSMGRNLWSMHRTAVLITGLALVAAACGGGATDAATPVESSTAQSDQSTQTTAVPATEPGTPPATEDTESPSEEERPAPDPNREIAPDFDLLLSDGSTFVLSDETRPVFMVFWAEW